MSLGPVVRNVFKHEHAEPPKPHLDARLEEGDVRYNALGAIVNTGGKLTFRPAYAGERPAVLPTTYKEPAYVPFQGENAYLDPAPMQRGERVKVTNIPTLSSGSISAGFNPKTSALQVGDRVKQVLKDFKNYEGLATVEEVTDAHYILKWDDGVKNPGNTKWHKNAERQCFEIVERKGVLEPTLTEEKEPTSFTFKAGDRVRKVNGPARLGQYATVLRVLTGHDTPAVEIRYDDGYEANGWMSRFEPAEATPAKQDWDPKTTMWQVGDRVRQIDKEVNNYRQMATIKRIEGTTAILEWDYNKDHDNGRWEAHMRKWFEIVERPTK